MGGVADSSDPRWGEGGAQNGRTGAAANFQDIDLGGLGEVNVRCSFPVSSRYMPERRHMLR